MIIGDVLAAALPSTVGRGGAGTRAITVVVGAYIETMRAAMRAAGDVVEGTGVMMWTYLGISSDCREMLDVVVASLVEAVEVETFIRRSTADGSVMPITGDVYLGTGNRTGAGARLSPKKLDDLCVSSWCW